MPLLHGLAVEVGRNFIFRGSKNCLNFTELAIPDSLSQRKYFGVPKGAKIIDLTASIISSVCLDLIAFNWIKPVNMSTARKIAVLPFLVVVKEGIMSTAQEILGAKTKSDCFNV